MMAVDPAPHCHITGWFDPDTLDRCPEEAELATREYRFKRS